LSKKTILFVRPSLGYGGADRVTLNLLNNCDFEKYDVSLALLHLNGEFQSYLDSRVTVYSLNASSLWFAVKPIISLLKLKSFDVVFSTCGGMSIPMMLAATISKFNGKTIVSERNSLDRTYSSWLKKTMLLGLKKRLYKRASLVTAVSEEIKEQIQLRFDVPLEQIKVVHNPLIDERFYEQLNEPVNTESIDKDKHTFIAIGRFVKQKDYPTLLKAFKETLVTVPNSQLVILGKGPLQSKINLLITELGLENDVNLIGFDPNPFKYLKHADVFVLSSLHEGMPGVLIQAMAAGLPCISTECPTGPKEIIVNSENGLLVPVGDYNKLATAMSELAQNSDLRKNLGERARVSVKPFGIKEGIESYFNLIN
jgi:glycosyltransferase involved in cell wall biosynthesis